MNVRMCFLAQYVLLSPLHDNFNRALAPRRFALLENVAFLLSKKNATCDGLCGGGPSFLKFGTLTFLLV